MPIHQNEMAEPVVLIVDDVPASLGLMVETLEDAGYTVLVADDGPTALQRLRQMIPDAILLDAVMPGMSGFDVCKVIKSDPDWRHIPVIFMTGLSETTDILEGFASGGTDYVVKPVQPAEVLARLRTHIACMQSMRAVEEAVDVGGAGLVMLDQDGRMLWHSPCARQLLMRTGIDIAATDFPTEWGLLDVGSRKHLASESGCLGMQHLATSMQGERMLLVSVCDAHVHIDDISRLALTPRETEVLYWLAKGKTNRDIGDILQLSPRTVSKHLEHVFQKMGVETRSAAAAMATSLQLEEVASRH